ncbi:MAG: cysteine synthase family protein, partial [Anaeroplasmataceae bacterium]|nr:cysteine synthase family protein [Anaeroplasmataceae bacterium]
MFKNSPLELIGNTPLVRLYNIEKDLNLKAELYAKLESFNWTGSVKDRAAYQIILDAKEKGLLKEHTVILEPSSGNMGISLSAIGSYFGHQVFIVMPDSMSEERRRLIKLYGGNLILTDGKKGMSFAVSETLNIAKKYSNVFIPNQFENSSNSLAHYLTTGKEIFNDLPNVDIVVAGIGSGGTITGVGRYLKEKNHNIQIIGVEPEKSPILTQNRSGLHQIEGIGAGFIPKILRKELIDEIYTCPDEKAFLYQKMLQEKEKIWVGISSGAALSTAIKIASSKENKGKKIV